MHRELLSGAILLTGLLYLGALTRPPGPVRYALKPLPVLLIIALAATGVHDTRSWLVLAGLTISIVGDICLLFPERLFVHGLSAFLTAHILYTAAFVLAAPGTGIPSVLVLAALAAAAVPVFRRLRSGVLEAGGKAMLIAVGVYMAAITMMVWRAIATGSPLLAAGAVLFYLSDATLACNRFARSYRWAEYVVMGTYYAAQYCLALTGAGDFR